MTALAALRDGVGRVNRAPAILIGVWLMTLAVTLPMTMGLRATIADSLGSSLAAERAASGVDYVWMQEFSARATGLGATFGPGVIGFGAVLDNLGGFVDNVRRPVAIVSAAAAYLLLWLFTAGGIVDRYARDRPIRAHGFFAVSGVFFFRFLRLAVVMWSAYACLFALVHPWLFDRLYPALTRETTVERTAFFVRVSLYAVFGAVLAFCNAVFDYAKVRAVVEDRRSMAGALWAALRFVARNRGAVALLYLADGALFLLVLFGYALVAPGAGGPGLSLWIGVAIGQLYVLARLWIKLVFWASETALFQSRLAHARYAARPVPAWPESPAAEGIRNEL